MRDRKAAAQSLSGYLLMEMVARYLKTLVRLQMRSAPNARLLNVAVAYIFKGLASDECARILLPATDDCWMARSSDWNWVRAGVADKFEQAFVEKEQGVPLRSLIDVRWVVRRVSGAYQRPHSLSKPYDRCRRAWHFLARAATLAD